ncbi:MAG: MGMT family protein [Candidatus Peregrinibacteria bacterium]|nr:MGMT family protein [Candidatus Peregrinibacteria bacterium]
MKTNFNQKVYEIAGKIPAGKVATYGQLAKLAGSPRAARAVGMCMRNNTDRNLVPCHRVVASNGELTGYAFGGLNVKRKLLVEEGVSFNKEKVDLKVSQWKS